MDLSIVDLLSILAGSITVFGVFDQFVEERHKHAISWYLFGFSRIGFKDFEKNLIAGLIGVFERKKKICLVAHFDSIFCIFCIFFSHFSCSNWC